MDSAGNLYVANHLGSQILVYSPGYAQMKAKTITAGISSPFGVAFDPLGNLWVSNSGNNTVTQYTNGVQNAGATISNGISSPGAIAVDALGDVYVANNSASVTVYAPTGAYSPASQLVQTFIPANCDFCLHAIAVAGPAFYYGLQTGVFLPSASVVLRTGNFGSGAYGPPFNGLAMAADASGNVYCENQASGQVSVSLLHTNSTATTFIANLGFGSLGMAVDNVRKRVYISNASDNTIVVYSTAGALLHTITN